MRLALPATAALVAALAACSASSAGVGQVPPASSGGAASARSSTASTPGFKIEEVTGGLEHGWDIGFLPDGKVLVSERIGRFTLLSNGKPGAAATRLKA